MTLRHRSGLLVSALLILGGCSATKITNTWEASGAQTEKLGRVLVVAQVGNEPARRQLEDRVAAELGARGIATARSYQLAKGERLTTEELQQVAATNDFDGMLVTRYLGTDRETYYEPSYSTYGYPGSRWPEVYGRGRLISYEIVKAEGRLLSAKDGSLLWAATAETSEPGSPKAAADKIARKVVERLDNDIGI